jgi:hypothetical protein
VQENGAPIYVMSRTIKTIDQLWREWFEGLAPHPSIETLEARYGSAWRQPQQERTWFSRRKRIIDFLRMSVRTKNIPPQIAVARLEEIRLRSGWSLHRTAGEIGKNSIVL